MSFQLTSSYVCPLLIILTTCTAHQFDRRYTGVVFSPYVKMAEYNKPLSNTYTTKEVRLMLEVISEKFSRVIATDTGLKNDAGPYVRNVTYYKDTGIEVSIAETAATINLHRRRKDLTIIQGIWRKDNDQLLNTEVQLGLECAEKANQIYPETVEGLLINGVTRSFDYDVAKRILEYLHTLRNSTTENLKFGVTISCEKLCQDTRDDNHLNLLNDVVKLSDFLVFEMSATDEIDSDGPIAAFEAIASQLLEYRRKLPGIKAELETMAHVGWSSEGSNKWHNLKNFLTFFEYGNQWAVEHKFPIWLSDAYDTPWLGNNTPNAHRGWWRLSDNSKSNQREGYIEKITEYVPDCTTGPANINESTSGIVATLIAVSITLGCLLIVGIIASVVLFFFRFKPQYQQLSNDDIRQFREGVRSEFAVEQARHNVDTSAFQFPYDATLEIEKEQLVIQNDKLLGMGQFGCVFKAMIVSHLDGCKHVALKVARDDCPKDGLKGLLSEIKIMTYIGRHPNIVELMGAFTKELHKGVVYIATEFCSLGSLQNHLRKLSVQIDGNGLGRGSTPEQINFQKMLNWSQEIARGMEYLGLKNVVHADLATRNVLLTAEETAKISDFGLSRRMYDYALYTKMGQEPLPWRWMAIESLQRSEFAVTSDVWSYGVTLWEIFSLGETPYAGLAWTPGFANMLVGGLRLECPTHATTEVYALMMDCWNLVPCRRPSFSEIKLACETTLPGNNERTSAFPLYDNL